MPIPEHWTEATLGSLCEIWQGRTLAVSEMDGGSVPVYGANGVIGSHSESNVADPIVALGCRGSCGTVNLVAVEAWLANNVMALRPLDEDVLDLGFLKLFCEITNWVACGAQSGQVQQQITKKGLDPVRVLLPSVVAQRRIVDLIESVDSYIGALRIQADAARTARTSLLNELLNAGGEDWEETTVGAVTSFAGGNAFPHKYQGVVGAEIPFVKVADMNSPGNELRIASAANTVDRETLIKMCAKSWPAGTVVFPKVGAALLTEKRRILGRECAIDNNCLGLIASEGIDSMFLLYFMETVRLADFAQHGAVPSVNQGHVSGIRLLLPPVDEQRRICDLIGSVDQNLGSTVRAMEHAQDLRSGLMSELLSGAHEIPESYDVLLEAS